MATKQAVNKTQAVLDYLKAHPAAMCREIVAALDKQGIKITFNHVATIKAMAYETAAPLQKPTDTLTRDQLKMVAQAIKRIRIVAKPHGMTKSQAIRDYLKMNPKAEAQEVVDALAKQGITTTVNYINIHKAEWRWRS